MTELELNKRLFLPTRYLIDERNNFFLLYDWQNHIWIIVNRYGKEIIDFIEKGENINTIIAGIISKYGLERKVASEKAITFINYLLDSKFVYTHEYKCNEFPSLETKKDGFSCSIIFQKCNLDCLYCYNRASRKKNEKKHKTMTTLEFTEALDQLIDFGVKQMMFSGGEPTLRDDLYELMRFVKKKNNSIFIALITNGTKIGQAYAKNFSKICNLIWVSLDSYSKEEHERLRGNGTFEKTINAINLLVREKAKILVNSMISDFNYKSIEKTRSFITKELGVKNYRMSLFQPFKNIGENKNDLKLNPPPFVFESSKSPHYDFFYQFNIEDDLEIENIVDMIDPLPKRIHCGVGHGEFSLHDNGDIYPCQSLSDEKFKCGNILKENISEIYHKSTIMKKCRNLTVDKIDKCKDCEVKFICCGGCRAAAYEIHGDIDAHLELFCEFNKRKAIDRLWRDKMLPFKDVDKLKEKYSKQDDKKIIGGI